MSAPYFDPVVPSAVGYPQPPPGYTQPPPGYAQQQHQQQQPPLAGQYPPPAGQYVQDYSHPAMSVDAGGAREFLQPQEWPEGMINFLIKNVQQIPFRFFICDDSGSMVRVHGVCCTQ
jgi:hypothetical protein